MWDGHFLLHWRLLLEILQAVEDEDDQPEAAGDNNKETTKPGILSFLD